MLMLPATKVAVLRLCRLLTIGSFVFSFCTTALTSHAAEWIATGSGSWSDGSNWDIGTAPNNQATLFGPSITGNATVTLEQNRFVTDLTFDTSRSYNLDGGTLTISGDTMVLGGSNSIGSAIRFEGGTHTISAVAGSSLDLTGITSTTNGAPATLILDGSGSGSLGVIRHNPELVTDDVAIIKRGLGAWTVGAGNGLFPDFHAGNTTVEAGRLIVRSDAPGGNVGELRSPEISVHAGATFDISNFGNYSLQAEQRLSGGGIIDSGGNNIGFFSDNLIQPGDGVGNMVIIGDLSLVGVEGNSPSGGLEFELSSSTFTGNDGIILTGNLDSRSGGPNQKTRINIVPTGTSLASGTYELIRFSGSYTGNASNFVLDNSLETRFTQNVTTDSNSINLEISGSNAGLVWRGNDGVNPTGWDVNGISNWSNSGASDVFLDLDFATFDDSAVSTNVEVQTDVHPAVAEFNNSIKDFVVSGTGSIAGAGSITKTGSGRVTLNLSNSYTGMTTINDGILHADNDAALGSSIGGTVVSGGTLDITGSDITDESVSIEGSGFNGMGALMTAGFDAMGQSSRQVSEVIQTGDATVAAYYEGTDSQFNLDDYRWDLAPANNSTAASWIGNGHDLTKKGRGAVSLQRAGEINVPNVNVEAGTLIWQGSTTSTGATITIGQDTALRENFTGNASLSLVYSGASGSAPNGGVHSVNIVLDGGNLSFTSTILEDVSVDGTIVNNDVSRNTSIDNSISSNTAGRRLKLTQGITGDGDLRFTGVGVVELQGNNTYSGRTEVLGNVALVGSSNLSSSSVIDVIGTETAPATFDVTERNDGTLMISGQSLNLTGAASIIGNVTVGAFSAMQTSNSLAENITPSVTGDLTIEATGAVNVQSGLGPVGDPAPLLSFAVGGDLTMEEASTLEVDLRSLEDFDNLSVAGTANLNGTIFVGLDGFIPEDGDTFVILEAGSLIDSGISVSVSDGSAFSFSTSNNRVTLSFGIASVTGDFDGNGIYDCADIDALTVAVAADSNDGAFDLDGDGSVDSGDVQAWLAEAGEANLGPGKSYLSGDANLDGVVDVSDFAIWNSNKFTTTGAWCQADFTADGVTDVSDFAVWNSNKFTSSDVNAVPEPSAITIFAVAMGCLLWFLRAFRDE